MMNKRIRALAVQAGIDFFNSTDAEFIGKEYCEAWIEQQQKFAQLIIAHATECVRDVLRDEDSDLTYPAATQVQNRIKQYFGVEY